MTEPASTPAADLSLLRLLQLASPALPVGGFAYSQGLESAVHAGWIRGEADVQTWMAGLLTHGFGTLDVPCLLRLHAAFANDDDSSAWRWNDRLLASRGAAELADEDRHMGAALARLLLSLGIERARAWANDGAYAALFALACATWNVAALAAATGFAFAWAEAQTGAAARMGVLGQTAAQRILQSLAPVIETTVEAARAMADDDIASSASSQIFAAIAHETQYSRLFRS